FFSSRRRHTRFSRDWSSDVCSSDLVTATNFILSSDKRLKQNFNSLGNGYYSFEFKDKPGEKRYGVIAQEVKKYAPELVSEGEDRSEERRVGKECRYRRWAGH